MQEHYENKSEFIDDILLLVDKSISYRFLEQIPLRKKAKTFQRKKAALTQFQVRLDALKAQEDIRNQLIDDELKNIARTFFILLLQKNFFTLTYETWVADIILKELNTNAHYVTLRHFLFPKASSLGHSDLRNFVCNDLNNKKRFSLWNRQTTFMAFWQKDSEAKDDNKLAVTSVVSQFFGNAKPVYIAPHAERLLLAAKIFAFAALITLATMVTLLSMGAGSPLLIVMLGIGLSALFACAWSISKKVAKDNTYSNMHDNEKKYHEKYHKTFAAAAA